MKIDRRSALSGLAAGLTGTSIASPLLAKTRGSIDLTSPAGRMRTFMLMRGALDEDMVISWASARYYAVVEDKMEPLFGVVSAVFARYRQLTDGGVDAVNAELAWFTDPESGKAMDRFRNPWNGRDVTVPGGGFRPSKIRFGADLSFHLANPVPGMELSHEVLPIEARGQDVWMIERSRSAMNAPGLAKPFRYSESNIFHARRSDLEARGATRVISDVSFTNVCSWRPWLEMGEHPGHMTAAGVGRHGATMASLPPAWIEATRARKPDVLKDPAALLAPLWDAA